MTETSARQKLRVSFSARCSFCSRATAVVAFLCSLALMLLGGCNGSGSSTPAPPASILGVAVATNPPGMSSGARLLAVRRRAHSPDISSWQHSRHFGHGHHQGDHVSQVPRRTIGMPGVGSGISIRPRFTRQSSDWKKTNCLLKTAASEKAACFFQVYAMIRLRLAVRCGIEYSQF